jgi:hypothetical protein
MMMDFTPSWRRPHRDNDVVPPPPSSSSSSDVVSSSASWWRRYPCLVCGVREASALPIISNSHECNNGTANIKSSSNSQQQKRCSRCHAVVYCSVQCQQHDYITGKHKANCIKIGQLWKEKSTIEQQLWSSASTTKEKKEQSTNPFDDDDDDINIQYPTVGKFWYDHPSSEIQRVTTKYCIILLQLVQLLGRAESWRVAASNNTTINNVNVHRRHQCQPILIDDQQPTTTFISGVKKKEGSQGIDNNNNENNEHIGNPVAREIALDIAYTLLYLDQTDMRIRLLIPSLLLESGYRYEAYNYLRHWLSIDTSMAIMDLAIMSDLPGMTDTESTSVINNVVNATTTFSIMTTSSSSLPTYHHDLLEPIEQWMDGDMVYTSIGMVFEMAYLKCHLLCSLKRGGGGGLYLSKAVDDDFTKRCATDDDDCVTADTIKELTRQVALLLSVVHRWNPHLLPKLADTYDTTDDKGDIVDEATTVDKMDDATIHHRTPPPPPALSSLLNVHPPGFELQYKMGNPGGGTIDEAVSIWQRNMILWHIVDPMTMEYLSNFCSRLDENLVNTSVLNGSMRDSMTTPTTTMEKQHNNKETDGSELKDGTISTVVSSSDDKMSNEIKRREAEELVRKLQEEKPERTMGQIMMHPDMAALMIKHLHTNL